MDQLSEARTMLDQLAAIIDRLTRSDRRFLESWTAYLNRTSDGARIGPHRLAQLRKVAARYFPDTAESAPGVAPLAVPASVKG